MILPQIIGLIFSVQAGTYDYALHGDDWAEIDEYCSGKTRQSPIDLSQKYTTANEDDVYFFPKYQSIEAKVVKDNTTDKLQPIQTSDSFGPLYTINPTMESQAYQAKTIQFRSEAEHTIGGVRYPLEVQIHHTMLFSGSFKSSVSVFFQADETASRNPFLQKVIDNYYSESFTLDLSQLINQELSIQPFFFYLGSFTYPSCTEKTYWYIFEKPFKAPSSQLKFFYDLYHNNQNFTGEGNYRHIQNRATTAKKVELLYRKNPYAEQYQNE